MDTRHELDVFNGITLRSTENVRTTLKFWGASEGDTSTSCSVDRAVLIEEWADP